MKSLLKHLPLTVLAVVLSCQKPDPVQPKPDSEDPVDKYEATITLTDATVTLGAEEGSTASLVFACDHKWTLEIPEDAASWLSAEKTSGKSGKTITALRTLVSSAASHARQRVTVDVMDE